jgi:hypothetical protein
MHSFAQDLRFAVRALRRNPGFAAVAVLTLALGIGANAMVFGLMEATLLRAPAVSSPETLAAVYTTFAGQSGVVGEVGRVSGRTSLCRRRRDAHRPNNRTHNGRQEVIPADCRPCVPCPEAKESASVGINLQPAYHTARG